MEGSLWCFESLPARVCTDKFNWPVWILTGSRAWSRGLVHYANCWFMKIYFCGSYCGERFNVWQSLSPPSGSLILCTRWVSPHHLLFLMLLCWYTTSNRLSGHFEMGAYMVFCIWVHKIKKLWSSLNEWYENTVCIPLVTVHCALHEVE